MGDGGAEAESPGRGGGESGPPADALRAYVAQVAWHGTNATRVHVESVLASGGEAVCLLRAYSGATDLTSLRRLVRVGERAVLGSPTLAPRAPRATKPGRLGRFRGAGTREGCRGALRELAPVGGVRGAQLGGRAELERVGGQLLAAHL